MGSLKLVISFMQIQGDDRLKLSWTIPCDPYDPTNDDDWEPPAYDVSLKDVLPACNALRSHFRHLAFYDPSTFSDVLGRLIRRGSTLFSELMPDPNKKDSPDIRTRIEEIIGDQRSVRHDFKIILDTDKIFIPWGFLFVGSPEQEPRKPPFSLASMQGFWLSRFNISVTYSGDPMPLPRQPKNNACHLMAVHDQMFVDARRQLSANEEYKKRIEDLLALDMSPAARDWNAFKAQWSSVAGKKDSILYFYGHSDGQKIILDDESSGADDPDHDLLTVDFKRLRVRSDNASSSCASIFLLNGCVTAAPSGTINVPITTNFLAATRQAGFFGFIGTEAQVSNVFAFQYGIEFLTRLRQGKSVGETFDKLLQEDALFPQNLLYACYAERKFRVAPASSQ